MYNCPSSIVIMRYTERLIAVLALLALPALAQKKIEFYNGKEVAEREVIVRLRDTNNATKASIHLSADADDVRQVGSTNVVEVIHSRSKNVTALMNELSRRSDIRYAEPNYVYHVSGTPNDPSFSSLWGLSNTGQSVGGQTGTVGSDIGASLAWDVSTGSVANVIGVVDTGLDYTHPDLAANIWSAPAAFTVSVGGHSISCPAGSHGFNAITLTCDPMDDNNHGTHVSGTIGAVGNNAAGVAGVNWTTRIMGLKFLDSTGSGTLADAVNAIDFSIQVKSVFAATGTPVNVRVLSNSWGGAGFTQTLLDAINRAGTADMLFVVAAGNSSSNIDSSPTYPASYNAPNVISVAATDNRDALASFSNWGPVGVALGAPGVYITSTVRGGGYAQMSGTSMATPHVSGAAMLLLSRCTLNTAALRSTLLSNVDLVSSMSTTVSSHGRLNVNKAIRACSAPALPASSAAFVQLDSVTQGNWKSAYGGDGYSIAGDGTSYPAYAQVTFSRQSFYTWSTSTSDVRALQKVNSVDHAAATWFTASNYDIDVNITDGHTHQVSLYNLDWDWGTRTQRIDVLDAASGTVLNSQSVTGFYNGKYTVWNISGNVIFRVVNTGSNAVVSAIFFGTAPPAVAATATAGFVQADSTTSGSWKGIYGSDGYNIIADATSLPSYANTTLTGNYTYIWGYPADTRALQRAVATGRIAATAYSDTQFLVDINLTDTAQHQVALYLLDYDTTVRSQKIEVVDFASGNVLDSRTATNFNGGVYYVYNIKGHVFIRMSYLTGYNPVLSGIFFAPASGTVAPPPPPTTIAATYVKTDTTTLGSWKGVYGAGGYIINADPGLASTFAQLTVSGSNSYTWAASTTDTRALQKTGATDRIAATWFNDVSFTVDVNITDGGTHQLAVYCLDYDNLGRGETIDILNAVTGGVLDTKSMTSFTGGKYLVYNVSGHVQVRVTRNVGMNAVVSGVFLGP